MRTALALVLTFLASVACSDRGATAVDARSDATLTATSGGARDASASNPSLAQRDLAELRQRAVHDAPSVADVQAIVRAGIPKPPDPRAAKAHAALMGWSQDAATLAFLAATDEDATAASAHAARLARLLRAWVAYGTDFGDPEDTANYGNATLELTWFLGNVARAGAIEARAAGPSAWSDADRSAFAAWAHALAAKYVDFGVFAAGLSNRKASQIETLMRVAALDGGAGEPRIASLLGSLSQLLAAAIRDRGDVPEDSPRDKYHPQFFLASALQALALAAEHGHAMSPTNDATALAHLGAAIRYAARENLDDSPPPEYPAIGDAHPDHDIPLWPLARAFLLDHARSSDADVEANIGIEYARPRGFVMQWGFPALSLARDL